MIFFFLCIINFLFHCCVIIIIIIFCSPLFNLEKHLVVIQCDSGHMNGDLIACARHRIYDLKIRENKKAEDIRQRDDQAEGQDTRDITNILFIIHLPLQVAMSSFIGFQGDPWISVHIDDLRLFADYSVSASEAIGMSINELFLGTLNAETITIYHPQHSVLDHKTLDASHMQIEDDASEEQPQETSIKELSDHAKGNDNSSTQPAEMLQKVDSTVENLGNRQIQFAVEEEKADLSSLEPSISSPSLVAQIQPVLNSYPLYNRLHDCIQAAASKLEDFISIKRSTKRVEILIRLIPKKLPKPLGMYSLLL